MTKGNTRLKIKFLFAAPGAGSLAKLGLVSAFDAFDAGLVCGGYIGESADVGGVQFQSLTVFVDLAG